MLVVGGAAMQAYWARKPGAEAKLRALHALLGRAEASDLPRLLAAAEQAGGEYSVGLGECRVRIAVNVEAGLCRIVEVTDEPASPHPQ